MDFKCGNITKYLILEGLDVVGQTTLLVDVKVPSPSQLTNGVWLGCGIINIFNLVMTLTEIRFF
jgi:hypothetical protein